MTGAREKLVRILDNERKWPDAHETADAILAAMPEIAGAMVEPLVWVRNGEHHAGGYGYVVRLRGMRFILTARNRHPQEFDTLEAAKAAANTHHRAHILAALGITQEGET